MTFEGAFENQASGSFYASQNELVGTEFLGSVTNHGNFYAADLGRLMVRGDWVNDGNFSPGSGTLTLAKSGKQFFLAGVGSPEYYTLTVESGANVEIQSNVTVLHDLKILAGGALDLVGYLLKVDNQLLNSGKISQTFQVSAGSESEFLRIPNKAGTRWVYYGLSMTPAVDMGQTRVTIEGSPLNGCSSNSIDSLVRRCFWIGPQNPASATIRFYFLGSELNGQVLINMKLWRFESSWSQEGNNYTRSDECTSDQLDCWLQAEAISEYVLFGLGSGGPPTIVKLAEFTGTNQKSHPENGLFLLILIVLTGICWLLKKGKWAEFPSIFINRHR